MPIERFFHGVGLTDQIAVMVGGEFAMAGRIDWRSVKAGAAHQVEQYRVRAEKGGSCLVADIRDFNCQCKIYEVFWLVVRAMYSRTQKLLNGAF